MTRIADPSCLTLAGTPVTDFRGARTAAGNALKRWKHDPDWQGIAAICRACKLGAILDEHEGRWFLHGDMTKGKCRRRE